MEKSYTPHFQRVKPHRLPDCETKQKILKVSNQNHLLTVLQNHGCDSATIFIKCVPTYVDLS